MTVTLGAADGNFNADHEQIQGVIDTSGFPAGKHIIFVEAMDEVGNWGVPTAIFLNITGLTTTFLPMLYR
jgi:hypothetical protein